MKRNTPAQERWRRGLLYLMEKLGVDKATLIERTGLSRNYVYKVTSTTPQRCGVSGEVQTKMADALGVRVSEIWSHGEDLVEWDETRSQRLQEESALKIKREAQRAAQAEAIDELEALLTKLKSAAQG